MSTQTPTPPASPANAGDAEKLAAATESMPPEQAVEALIDLASKMRASDLFIFAEEEGTTIAVRHLGILRELARLDKDRGKRYISAIKANAGMDVAERRRPQDGRWVRVHEKGGATDLRVNTIPSLWGEDCTLRLLERDSQLRDLDKIGLYTQQRNEVLTMLAAPSGLILVTGPTGSGKTTTLYACLRHLITGTRKINTIEDPIEYAVEGLRQSQINPHIGLDYPDLLISVLRQAPDVIMIGEIRDPTTAQAAVRAANSGHLVFATLHAPIAAGAVASMVALGASRHFLASCLLGIISQRLVRVLCKECRVKVDISDSPETFESVRQHLTGDQGKYIYGPGRCDACFHSGYTDRVGVFEVLHVTRSIRQRIARDSTTQEIEDDARRRGMIDFRQAAMIQVARGTTSMEEVLRTVPVEYLGVD
jgi:type II secretory ATPase GspE/PulE/Tfp pilus assembly ATPase PilB-like protein